MPYYHVRVESRSHPLTYAVSLDLSRDEVVERIRTPFQDALPLMVGGRPFAPDDIGEIRVAKTDVPSDELLPSIEAAMQAASVFNPTVGLASPGSFLVTDGRFSQDVTDEFMKTAPTNAGSKARDKATLSGSRIVMWPEAVVAGVVSIAAGLLLRWLDALSLPLALATGVGVMMVLLAVVAVARRRRLASRSRPGRSQYGCSHDR